MPSQCHEQPADNAYGRALLSSVDNFSGLRRGLSKIAQERGDWAGIPMPLEGQRLIIEPTYPKAKELSEIGAPAEEPSQLNYRIRNKFHSRRKGRDVIIYDDIDTGRVEWGTQNYVNHIDHQVATLGASFAWGIEQEHNALQLLGTLVRHHTFKQYLLTGMFLETSQRSRVTYLFRKLRPTLAISLRDGKKSIILAALCMHPIGYYEGSWAGAMCPTDDVIAHLMLMRGDEPMFWRRCNQIPPYRPEAGI